MSLRLLANKVEKISQKTNGLSNSLGSVVMRGMFGHSTFLRNEAPSIFNISGSMGEMLDTVNKTANLVKSISALVGNKDQRYIIGKINDDSVVQQFKQRALAIISGGLAGGYDSLQKNGVIIDGFDDCNAELTVGLPSQPVMYTTEVVNQRVRNPNTLKMRVFVTNLNSDDVLEGLVSSIRGGISNVLLDTKTRAQIALENLQWLQENAKPFKIYTTIKVYDNMLIEKITPISNKMNNDMLVCDIYFREVVFSQSLGNASKSNARNAPNAVISTWAKAKKFFGG